jgi:hypothetical protein
MIRVLCAEARKRGNVEPASSDWDLLLWDLIGNDVENPPPSDSSKAE